MVIKKVAAASTAVLISVITAKQFQNYNKKVRHKTKELAKPYLPTLKEDLLGDVVNTTSREKKTCLIIGGGIAGIASAYELCEKGHSVILLEKHADTGTQCSAAPAGGMQRSNPTVDSSMWIAAAKSIFGIGPIQYFKINFWETLTDPHFLRWFSDFTINCVATSSKNRDFYQDQMLGFTNWAISDLADTIRVEGLVEKTGLVGKGALQLHYTPDDFASAKEKLDLSHSSKGEMTVLLSREEVLDLEPCLAQLKRYEGERNDEIEPFVGASFQPYAASGSCLGYTSGMMKVLSERHKDRFRVESNVSVVDFEAADGFITQVYTSRGTLNVPGGVEVIVAAGSWTPLILRKLNLYCPVYPMKGYNMIVDLGSAGLNDADFPSRVVYDSLVYSSTLSKQLRVASFGEFDGWNTRPNLLVVQDLRKEAGRMYPTLHQLLQSSTIGQEGGSSIGAAALPSGVEVKTGLRPFVSDGRLVVGRISEYHNLSVNVGPGFNGWKVATGAAKVLEAEVTGIDTGLPEGTFDRSVLSPRNRVVLSPWFCRLVDLLSYHY